MPSYKVRPISRTELEAERSEERIGERMEDNNVKYFVASAHDKGVPCLFEHNYDDTGQRIGKICRETIQAEPFGHWICTRHLGHSGPHEARNGYYVFARWTDENKKLLETVARL